MQPVLASSRCFVLHGDVLCMCWYVRREEIPSSKWKQDVWGFVYRKCFSFMTNNIFHSWTLTSDFLPAGLLTYKKTKKKCFTKTIHLIFFIILNQPGQLCGLGKGHHGGSQWENHGGSKFRHAGSERSLSRRRFSYQIKTWINVNFINPPNTLGLDSPTPVPPLLSGSEWRRRAWPVGCRRLHENSAGSLPDIRCTACCRRNWTGFGGSTGYGSSSSANSLVSRHIGITPWFRLTDAFS